MTPKEYYKEANAFARTVAPNAEVWTFISGSRWEGKEDGGVINATLYLDADRRRDDTLSVYADDFDALLQRLKEKWAAHKDEHERQLLRRMALKIIEIATETGDCTDAGLRGAGFANAEVAFYGQRACDQANAMAARGPFKLRLIGASNRAPAITERSGARLS